MFSLKQSPLFVKTKHLTSSCVLIVTIENPLMNPSIAFNEQPWQDFSGAHSTIEL
jgi:hypothetical protein